MFKMGMKSLICENIKSLQAQIFKRLLFIADLNIRHFKTKVKFLLPKNASRTYPYHTT